MAVDQRRRQKKLQRRKAKAKAQRRRVALRRPTGIASVLQQAAGAPILHCCVSGPIWDEGMGQVLLSRQLDNGQVAFAVFLVDAYCLGVKDALVNIGSRRDYLRNLYEKMTRSYDSIELRPECARKLVQGAVQYAEALGLSPHPDYHKAKLIFGDISAEACETEFVYGKNGMPHFIAGPHDSRQRCEQVLRILNNTRGPDGYRSVLPFADPMLLT